MNLENVFNELELPNPLSKNALLLYFEKFHNGDKVARKEIINHNIKLVLDIVYKNFIRFPYDKKELVSIGLIGLIKSVDTFDINKKCSFSTYASKCINNEILMFIRKEKKYILDESLEFCIADSDNDSKFCIADSDNDSKFINFIKDDKSDFVFDVENKLLYSEILKYINKLPEKEQKILILSYGLYDNKIYTQQEISEMFNLSQPQVCKIVKKNLVKIREHFLITIQSNDKFKNDSNSTITKGKTYK